MIGVAIGPPLLDDVPSDGSKLVPLGIAKDINIEQEISQFDLPVSRLGSQDTYYMPSRRASRLCISDLVVRDPRQAEAWLVKRGGKMGLYLQMDRAGEKLGAYLSSSYCLRMNSFWTPPPRTQMRMQNMLWTADQWTELDRRRLMIPWQAFEPMSERELVGLGWGSEPSRTAATVVDMGRNEKAVDLLGLDVDESGSIDWSGITIDRGLVQDLADQFVPEKPRDRMTEESGKSDNKITIDAEADKKKRPSPVLPEPEPVRRVREAGVVAGDEGAVGTRQPRTIIEVENEEEPIAVRQVRTIL